MKEWSRAERYRALQSPEELRTLYEQVQAAPWRQSYHVQPITGLSSDPNGFAFYKGQWHLCYQWCPWGAVHGLKYWYHVTSPDLLHWTNRGIALAPDRDFDNKGVHSGSAICVGDELCFYYTGNHRDENWVRTPWTCAAVLEPDGRARKLPRPLFGPRADYSEHQRDPKLVWNEEKGLYYIFLGAQSADQRGCVLVYCSEAPLQGWRFAGELKVPGLEAFGGMWECPCITRIGGKDLLLFSPQYLTLPGRGNSTNHNVYLLGKMDYDSLTFTPEGTYHFLDYGFDFYAAQLAANTGDPDKAVLIAWMGLPDNHYPSAEDDWEGSMTLPRELRIVEGRLRQTPISGVEALRRCELADDGVLPDACELELSIPEGEFELALYTRADGSGGLTLRYDAAAKTCTLDRRGMDKRFNQQVFEVLEVPLEQALTKLRIFLDRSSTEFFFNDGEAVFTTHSYPEEDEHWFTHTPAEVRMWELEPSVTDEFVV